MRSLKKEKEVKLVIFDLDGTLVNAYRAVAESVNFTMRAMGFAERSRDLIRRSVGWGDSHLIRKFVGDALFEDAISVYRKHHIKALKNGVVFLPGASSLLKILQKKNYKLAVATNRPSKFSHLILRVLDAQKYFDYVLCADQVARGKPDPMMLKKILKKFRFSAAEAVYAGDMGIDVQAGKAAGIRTVAVTTGSSSGRELRKLKPYRVISRIGEIKKFLK